MILRCPCGKDEHHQTFCRKPGPALRRQGERFVVRVDDRYAVEGGKFTSKEFATKYETREAAERLADSFRNAVVEKISIFD